MYTPDAIAALSVAERAAAVRELQKGWTRSREERAVRDILLATRGDALHELKALLDGGGDYHDLHQLVFHDLDDEPVRAAVLAHFASEAARDARRAVKVLSDIDDTFYANWKDDRYPSKTVYPGVRALYAELARDALGRPGGGVTFVTARPGDRAGVVQDHTIGSLRARGLAGEVRVLPGSYANLLGDESMAAKKLENFHAFRALYPEAGFVFLGDSGQGDALFGARMVAEAGDVVRAVFIHDVVATPEDARERERARGVRFVDTYVGAAVEARELGLLDDAGLERVARAAVADFAAIAFESEAQRAARLAEFERDLARVDRSLGR